MFAAEHFNQHVAEEIKPGDEHDHQPDFVRIDDVNGRRAEGLIGQERQNDHADHGKLQCRFNVGEFDAARQTMQKILEREQQQTHHRHDACHTDVVPAAQSTGNESEQRADFSGDAHLASPRRRRVGHEHQRAYGDKRGDDEPALAQLPLHKGAERAQ